MKTMIIKPQHETTVIGQMLSLKSQIDYHKKEIAPNLYQVEEWEQKEYLAVNAANKLELERLKQVIIEDKPTFNNFFQQYSSGLCVAIFINKYILK
jgi:hypothetical protein